MEISRLQEIFTEKVLQQVSIILYQQIQLGDFTRGGVLVLVTCKMEA